MEPQQQQQVTNGKAIAAMILGILSIVVPYGGIVLGIVGIVLAKKSLTEIQDYNQGGKGMAITGLVTSIIGLALYLFLLLILVILGGIASMSFY